jgi:hypothetical protein
VRPHPFFGFSPVFAPTSFGSTAQDSKPSKRDSRKTQEPAHSPSLTALEFWAWWINSWSIARSGVRPHPFFGFSPVFAHTPTRTSRAEQC